MVRETGRNRVWVEEWFDARSGTMFRQGQRIKYKQVECTLYRIDRNGGYILSDYPITPYGYGDESVGMINDERYNWLCYPAFASSGGRHLSILEELGCDECMSCVSSCKQDEPCAFQEDRK